MRNIVFEHLESLASPNLDSDSQESVFYRVDIPKKAAKETTHNLALPLRVA